MRKPLHILHLEDDLMDAAMIEALLEGDGHDCKITRVQGRQEFQAGLAEERLDLILSDFSMPRFDGLSALAMAREQRPEIPFIFISGTIGEDLAILALKEGATDYVLKDRMSRLPAAVERALRDAHELKQRRRLEAEFLRHQRIETIGALAGGIAHDLNNTLAPMLMGVSCLRQEPISPAGLRMLDIIGKSASRAADMVNQILSFSRGVGGRHGTVEVRSVVEEMSKLARETFPRSIKIETALASGLHPVKGNATQLHQVLLNLCVNARDAMAQGGLLTIEVTNVNLTADSLPAGHALTPGGYVLVAVTDTGQGIEPELLSRIFDPFFTTKAVGKGTGLGLSTAMGIVKTHGGFLEVTSKVGQGTTFKVYLPESGTEAFSDERRETSALAEPHD